MTTTYDLTTDIGKVRLKIADTDIVPVTDAHFSDEEIQVFLDEGGSVLAASALALEAWAASLTDAYTSEKIGDYAYTKKRVDNMLALAKNYKEADSAGVAIDWAEMDLTAIGEYPVSE